MRNFKELEIWKNAIELAVAVYKITRNLPPDERFGLRVQVNKAVISVSSNIAEGCSRKSQRDFKRFLEIALGSAMEVENDLIVMVRLGLVEQASIDEVTPALQLEQKQINSLISKIEDSNH